MPFSEQIISDIRHQTDVVQLIGRSVDLKQRGRNWVGLCPFHDEKTASFNVSPERGTYYCFGCHASGDAIAFLQRIEGKTFPEALRTLAELAGIQLEEQQETPEQKQQRERREVLAQVNSQTLDLYREQLAAPAGASARRYLQQRGITPEQIERYAIGYGGPGRQLPSKHALTALPEADLLEAGVLSGQLGDSFHRFAGRIMFPIRDRRGRVTGFGGRVFGPRDDGKYAKYLNSPESLLFHKSELLYGMYEAREALGRAEKPVLVEGYLDVIGLFSAGVSAALAPCGTALTRSQAALLRRYAARTALCFDGDNAGQKATLKALPLLLEVGLEVQLVTLPMGQDPDDLARQDAQQLRKLVEDAPLAVEALIKRAAAAHGHSVQGRLAAVQELRPVLGALPQGLARDLLLENAAQALSIEPSALRREMQRQQGASERAKRAPTPPADDSQVQNNPAPEKIHQRERQLVRLLVEWPELFENLLVTRLPALLQSNSVKLFVEMGREEVVTTRAVPTLEALRRFAQHPALALEVAEVMQNHRVFDTSEARKVLDEACQSLWRHSARRERDQMQRELQANTDEEQQIEMLARLGELNRQISLGCPWLDDDKQDGAARSVQVVSTITGA